MDLRSKTKPTMKPSKFYAVANGRINGVFNNVWDESRLLTDFYPRARHKGFDETEHAWKFILNENKAIPTPASLNEYRTLTNIDVQNLREQMEKDEKVSSVKKQTYNEACKPNWLGIDNISIDSTQDSTVPVSEWVVIEILDKRLNDIGGIEYLVRWDGFDDPTWEPEENCENSKEAIHEFNNKYLNRDPGPTTQKLTKDLLNIQKFDTDLISNQTMDDVMTMINSKEDLNVSLDSQLDESQLSKPNTSESCNYCKKFIKKNRRIFLTSSEEWSVNLAVLCKFSKKAMIEITSFQPNIMSVNRSSEMENFNEIWTHLIRAITNNRNCLQHISGILIQIFPALCLQNVSKDPKINREVLSKRLEMWKNGNFNELLIDAKTAQSNIKKKKPCCKINKVVCEKNKFLSAIKNGNIRKAAHSIDEKNLGVMSCTDSVVSIL